MLYLLKFEGFKKKKKSSAMSLGNSVFLPSREFLHSHAEIEVVTGQLIFFTFYMVCFP